MNLAHFGEERNHLEVGIIAFAGAAVRCVTVRGNGKTADPFVPIHCVQLCRFADNAVAWEAVLFEHLRFFHNRGSTEVAYLFIGGNDDIQRRGEL